MSGIGYLNPEWSDGLDKGLLATSYDTIDLFSTDPANSIHLHTQAKSEFIMNGKKGIGVLEQFVIESRTPVVFKEMLDMAS